VAVPLSYLLCGTPRTGSTLLCGLLTSTGVAGRPESYFREPDEHAWARRLGVPVAGDGSLDYRSFVRAVRIAGSTPNGVFGARVMWGTMQRIVEGLDAAPRRHDLDVLVDTFGPLRLVHLRRDDAVGQAVSWARAEQTGYWQEGDMPSARPRLEFDRSCRSGADRQRAQRGLEHLVRGAGRRTPLGDVRGRDREPAAGCPRHPRRPRHRVARELATRRAAAPAGR